MMSNTNFQNTDRRIREWQSREIWLMHWRVTGFLIASNIVLFWATVFLQ